MALASNPLIQALQSAKAQSASATNALKTPDSGASPKASFADVYARQKAAEPSSAGVSPAKARGDERKDVAAGPADGDKDVAASGKSLPAKSADTRDVAEEDADDASEDLAVVETPVDVVADPVQAATPAPLEVAAPVPEPDPSLLAVIPMVPALPVVAAPVQADDAESAFDPEADPLEDLPAVQMALEASKARQGSQSVNNDKHAKGSKETTLLDPSQGSARNPSLADPLPVDDDAMQSGDKAFSSLLDEGLKDSKQSASDTRMDNFADRLAAMSQAAQQQRPIAANAAPVVNQPLAMHQPNLAEEMVNRVMYLSSQNLKSAQIQLEPAELGRLDIRVDLAKDQSSVTFLSPHLVVREALESQMGRLRDSFQQQGLGQVDVNVAADQQGAWQGQRQQEQASEQARRSGNSGAGRSEGDDHDAVAGVDETPVVAQQVVGSSAVDYYA